MEVEEVFSEKEALVLGLVRVQLDQGHQGLVTGLVLVWG